MANQYYNLHNIPFRSGTKEYTEAWRALNKDKQQQYQKDIKLTHNKLKREAMEYLGGKCSKCGYDKCTASLDFHHKDMETKDDGISNKINRRKVRTLEQLIPELDKCVLLCSNCHRELHNKDEWYYN